MDSSTRSDVIVVGGGTAGSVIAGRIALEGGRNVCLVEAGPDYGDRNHGSWPADILDATTLPDSHDWGYVGTGRGGQALRFERARVIGGCSSHNGCAQTVGWSGDYDRWAAEGCDGWAAADLEPLFTRSGRRMQLRRYRDDEIQPFQRAFVGAAGALGIPATDDLDVLGGGVGVGAAPVNIAEGTRWNAAFAYLDPARTGSGLHVHADTHVDRLLIEGDRIRGVSARRDGTTIELFADLVIVCAGTYGSAELLLRSGIGPAADLERAGIRVIADLAGVGRNLHDQPSVQVEFEASPELARELSSFARARWLPEEQCIAKVVSVGCSGPYDMHVYPWIEPDASLATGWRCVLPVSITTPRSRGRLTLTPSDPAGRARIDHGFLTDDADTDVLKEGLRWLQGLSRAADLSRLLGQALSGPPSLADGDLEEWIPRNHAHYWHPAGTCRMGRADDPDAVVDPGGRVRGIGGLRVADASIFPEVPRGTPAWPTLVVGEKIADLVIGTRA